MKLKQFNTTNVKTVRKGKSTLRINSKTGLFSFSSAASERMGLSHESKVEFHQDEENPKDWYITVGTNDSGFEVRYKSSQSQFAFNSTAMAREILKSIDFQDRAASMIIAPPVKVSVPKNEDFAEADAFPIITSSVNQ